MEEKIILDTDDEAAQWRTGIEGWVDRHGVFWGKSELRARWEGCTHVACKGCGAPIERSLSICRKCCLARERKTYLAMERKVWQGDSVVYSLTHERFFADADELQEYLEDQNAVEDELNLVFCEPEHLRQVDKDYFDIEEEDDLPAAVREALAKLNQAILESSPIAWVPGKYAVVCTGC